MEDSCFIGLIDIDYLGINDRRFGAENPVDVKLRYSSSLFPSLKDNRFSLTLKLGVIRRSFDYVLGVLAYN